MVIRKVNVSATSEAELKMRMDDLAERGFATVKILPVERPEHRNSIYNSTERGARRLREAYAGSRYRAVMEKDFEEVIK